MFRQDQRLLEVSTPLGANKLVIHHLSASEFISGIFRFKLDLLAEADKQVDKKALVGQSILVTLRTDDTKRYFHGIVSKVTSGSRNDHFRHHHLEVVPWLWLLTLKTTSRIFQDKTVIQIIEAVFDELKGSFPEVNYRDATTGEHIPLDYCVQYQETDFNFVSRMMEQEGIFYFFEHTQDKHTLVFADANSAIAKCPGKSQVLYREGGIGEREGIITHWEAEWSEVPAKYSLRDHNFQLPSKSLEVNNQAQETAASGLEFYDYPGGYSARFNKPEQRLGLIEKEGEKRIRTRMEQELMEEAINFGDSTRPNLIAGYKFSLTKHFNGDGDYILTEVHHKVAQSPDYISGMVKEAPYQNEFTCVPAAVHLRPRRRSRKPVVPGPQTAVVAVKSGEESWLDKFGRVRVQFFWEREGKDNETSACWVRVAQKWAGTGWGAHFWPRVGQEVVVEFLEGDPDRPLITGSVYNPANMPPYPLPDNYTRSGILTASSKYNSGTNFNELRFEDKKYQEQIFINAERDMDCRVEHDQREFIGNDRDLIVKTNQTELIEAAKHEHVKVEHAEKVDGNASREVGGDHKEQIAGKLSLQVLGADHRKIGNVYTLVADEIHLKSSQKIVIDGLRISAKGPGGFVDIGGSGVAIQGIKVNINSGGSAASGTAASPDPPPPWSSAAGPATASGTPVTTNLGADVDKEVAKSPKFTKLIQDLKQDGWKIQYGPKGGGSYCDRNTKTIVMDENDKGDSSRVLGVLAHEGGHARYTKDKDPYVPPNGLTKQQYVKANVNSDLKDEGEATLTSAEIKDDLAAHGGPTIDVPGAKAAEYEKIAKKYPDPADRDKARQEIGDIFADNEHPSTSPNDTYRNYYAKPYSDYYDKLPANQKTGP